MKNTLYRVAAVTALMAALSAPWTSSAQGASFPSSGSSAGEPETLQYQVRPGDTLSDIARRFDTTTKKLQTTNGLNNSRIKAGQTLEIPSASADVRAPENQAVPSRPAVSESPAAAQTYKVRKGDTLFQIAKRFDTTAAALESANRLENSQLKIGQTLRLTSAPDAAEQTAPTVVPYAIKSYTAPGQAEAPARQAEAPARQAEAPARQAGSEKPAAAEKQAAAQTYKVRGGDTLFQIAKRFETTAAALQTANRLRNSELKIGQILKVPAVGTAVAKAQPASQGVKAPDFSTYVPREIAEEEELDPESLPVRQRLVEAGFQMLGIRYRYGGTSEKTGLDCSALVRNLFSKFNLQLPRSSREQFQQGQKVDRKDLQAGDLVFFSSGGKTPNHVGIYIGDNKFLHAARKARKVIVSDLGKLWYEKRYLGARRIMDLWWEETDEEPQSANN